MNNKYIKRLYLLPASALLFLAGCTGDIEKERDSVAGLRDVEVRFDLAIAGEGTAVTRSATFASAGESVGDASAEGIVADASGIATKAASVDESVVKTLWIGQYDASGNLLIWHYLSDVVAAHAKLQLKEAANCSLCFVANGGDLGAVSTLTAFNGTKINYATGNGGLTNGEGLPVNLNCPMLGQLSNQSISINYEQSITLTRMVTKVQLNYTIKGGFGFTLKGISLNSVPTQIQCVEPAGQVAGVTYQKFTGTFSAGASGSVVWYMPENKAGSITSGKDGFATSARDKRGSATSVPNATYIELTGDASVNGTTYTGVSFRLYPGSGINDYTMARNTPYVTNVTLSGIDLSDPRVSVTVPDIVAPTVMDAAIFSTKSIQATARPGTAWSITLPAWLSAQVGATTANAGGTVNYTGPTPIEFTAATANPGSSPRAQAFTIAGKAVTLTQAGAILTTPASSTVGVVFNSTGTSSFSATKGSLWAAASTTDWVKLTGQASGTLVAASQEIPYQVTTTNPNGAIRTGSITVKVGNAIGGTDAALLKTIQINQGASSISVPADGGTIPKEGGSITVSGIVGTSGLRWTVLPGSMPNGFTTSEINEEAGTFVVSAKQNGATERVSTLTLSVVGADPVREYLIKIKQPINTDNCVPGTTSMMASKALRGGGNYYNAATYCTNLTDVGYDDWRLPAPHELQAIYITKTEIGNITTLSGRFWSSSATPSYATYVDMNNGGQGNNYLHDSGPNVICVRGAY